MHYVVYVSQASAPMAPADLEALLKQSRASNSATGVTGLLLYRYAPDTRSGHFMQYLEGPADAVKALYAKIARDRRHHTVLSIEEGEVPARLFRDWTMAFKNVDTAALAAVPGYARFGEASFDAIELGRTGTVVELLRHFHEAD